jgi:hypothetical protein
MIFALVVALFVGIWIHNKCSRSFDDLDNTRQNLERSMSDLDQAGSNLKRSMENLRRQ